MVFRAIGIGFWIISMVAFLSAVGAAQDEKDVMCDLTISVDVPGPAEIAVQKTLRLTVTAHYWAGPAAPVRLKAVNLPPFASGWTNGEITCANCTLTRSVTLSPGLFDDGVYDFQFIAEAATDTPLVRIYPYRLTVVAGEITCDPKAPVIKPEPTYTRGTSNTIFYVPQCDAYEHQVCYFDSAESPDQLLGCRYGSELKSAGGYQEVIIEDLADGHTYGYFVTAYFLQYPDSVALSAVTYSTQDDSPPDSVITTHAQALRGGEVLVEWYGVIDRVSGVDRYELFRRQAGQPYQLIETIFAPPDDTTTKKHSYRESLLSGNGLEEGITHYYKIEAIDRVGNRGGGRESNGIVPDSTAPCLPIVAIPYDYRFIVTAYLKGTQCRVWGKSNCPGLQEAHFIRFQAVRDSLKFFDSEWYEGESFFDSEWLPYTGDSVGYVFDFLPPDGDSAYVNGHRYYIRAQAKDSLGNISYEPSGDSLRHWSKPKDVHMDVFPPSDIANLTATAQLDFTDSSSIIVVAWDAAVDPVSGLKHYIVYRKIGEGMFDSIAVVPSPGYNDADLGMEIRETVCYRVGSRDNVGNLRDYRQTEWQACVLPNLGPRISAECQLVKDDICYTGQDSVMISWNGYDGEGVSSYLVRCNNVDYYQTDPAADHLFVPVPTDGVYAIKVRALFANGIPSTWSNTVSVTKDGTPPAPIDSLVVRNSDQDYGIVFLEWNIPDDATGIDHYRIFREADGGQNILIGQNDYTNWPDNCPACTVYQHYTYTVHPVDLLGNEQDAGNARSTTYNRRPPTITDLTIEGGIITASWSRANPNRSSQWLDSVLVTRFRYTGGGYEMADSVFAVLQGSGCVFDAHAFGAGWFEFRIKEVPLDLESDTLSSAWSERKGVAFDYQPPPVANLTLQAQPMLPENEYDPVGSIWLSWEYDMTVGVYRFHIVRYRDGQPDRDFSIRPHMVGHMQFIFADSGLHADAEYRYCVSVIDRYRQESEPKCDSTAIRPIWVFTPRVKPFVPLYFNDDSLTVSWEWVKGAMGHLAPADTNFGAARCSVEVSIDPTFEMYQWSNHPVPADVGRQSIFIHPEYLDGIRTLYCRVMAQDRFGNWSPWSTEYFGLDSAIFDNIPPAPVTVTDRLLTVRADSSSLPGIVDLELKWLPSKDTACGVDHYSVYRDMSDNRWTLLGTTNGTTFSSENVNITGLAPCAYRYTVRPIDKVGNAQLQGNVIECLEPVASPQDLMALSPRDIKWAYPDGQTADGFYAECSYDSARLGTRGMNYLEDAAKSWVDFLARSYQFSTSETFIDSLQHPVIYFHIKAVKGGNESAWSEVCACGRGLLAAGLPDRYDLSQNYPNPFNPVTRISFSLVQGSNVTLRVYNVKGELVNTLVDGNLPAGDHVIDWDGTDDGDHSVASGIYFYTIKTTEFTATRKMVLVR
jgi:hypothetical protein